MSEAPNSGDSATSVQAYTGEHAQLVTTKGWKSWDDTIKSYSELETFRGAPAERLIRLPEKPEQADEAWRADLYKRAPYLNPNRAPAKAEDYGVKFEGAPEEFSAGIAALAHKHGLSPEALKEFADFNGKFGKEFGEKSAAAQKAIDDKIWTDRHALTESKLKERFGDKHGEAIERMTREATRLGFKDPAALEAFERTLAMAGETDLLTWRSALADLADARREGTFHAGGASKQMSPSEAQNALTAKMRDPEWGKKALTRDTDEAREKLKLEHLANGIAIADDELLRLSRGLTAQALK